MIASLLLSTKSDIHSTYKLPATIIITAIETTLMMSHEAEELFLGLKLYS